MSKYVGSVLEFRLASNGERSALIGCPQKAAPSPGQYLLALAEGDPDAILAGVVYPAEVGPGGFVAAPPIPPGWTLQTKLTLRGPLGNGFRLPEAVQNLALAALGSTPSRLLPLLGAAANIALFSPQPLFPRVPTTLPSKIEINPLGELSEALGWADFLAVDLPAEKIPDLWRLLGLGAADRLPCPAQALVSIPMPCGGVADCGVCAVETRQGYKLACKDGPVFEVGKLTG